MSSSPSAVGSFLSPGFWQRVRRSPHRLLMLDYDGTLAPFRVTREDARPFPGTIPLLRAIAESEATVLAVISGRPVSELVRFLGRLPLLLVGEHGWEDRPKNRSIRRHALPRAAAKALERAARAAEAAGWRGCLERKRASLVLHSRGLPRPWAREMEQACMALWARETSRTGLRLSSIDGGIELKAQDRDKGRVVRELLGNSPAGTLAVYLGDDETDEDAFRELRGRGLGIRVGTLERLSRAEARIRPGRGVLDFLRRWLAVIAEPRVEGEA